MVRDGACKRDVEKQFLFLGVVIWWEAQFLGCALSSESMMAGYVHPSLREVLFLGFSCVFFVRVFLRQVNEKSERESEKLR